VSMRYIRSTYRVPAKRGMRVTLLGREGVITGSAGARLRVRWTGETRSVFAHPVYGMVYHPEVTL